MKRAIASIGLVAGVLCLWPMSASGQSPTAFVYQGYLTDSLGAPITDTADFKFWLCSFASGPGLADPNANVFSGVQVTDGVFSVQLDFGPYAFSGQVRWLEICVAQPAGSTYETLAPRQGLPPLPYAFALPTSNVINGYSENGIPPDAGTLVGVTIGGGGGLSSGVDPNWPPLPPFDPNDPNGPFSPDPNDDPGAPIIGPFAAPNIVTADLATIGGGAGNMAGGELTALRGSGSGTGSTIGGGKGNQASGSYSTVGGGYYNTASGSHSTVTGGRTNTASGSYSTVNSGYNNKNSGYYGSIGGGYANQVCTGSGGTVSGGQYNTVGDPNGNWSCYRSSIVGGYGGRIVRGDESVILGGWYNTIDLPQYEYMSMAYGRNVAVKRGWQICLYEGSYWGYVAINRDSDNGLDSTGNKIIQVGTNIWNGNGAYLSRDGQWYTGTGTKDGAKSEALDGKALLSLVAALPVQAQVCKETGARHIGPFADDFHALFDVGPLKEDGTRDTEGLAASDVAGVALAGVQQLIKENEELRSIVAELQKRIEELEQQR